MSNIPERGPQQQPDDPSVEKLEALAAAGAGKEAPEVSGGSLSQRLKEGDTLVSRYGTRREVLDIIPDAEHPGKFLFKFEKIGPGGGEETFNSDDVDRLSGASIVPADKGDSKE